MPTTGSIHINCNTLEILYFQCFFSVVFHQVVLCIKLATISRLSTGEIKVWKIQEDLLHRNQYRDIGEFVTNQNLIYVERRYFLHCNTLYIKCPTCLLVYVVHFPVFNILLVVTLCNTYAACCITFLMHFPVTCAGSVPCMLAQVHIKMTHSLLVTVRHMIAQRPHIEPDL
ncbi:hypothetical protein GDO78_009826 [Eleutherodactylus coqui]|uniref:Uncharacterized protein n=1 Tax=Eleutherodactylus coqui TaxID=57060 RepID=A0A8J6FB54_ELECQ|nr:hypothetical protein GDO78_009826 [Eleutherodactylus coqui]